MQSLRRQFSSLRPPTALFVAFSTPRVVSIIDFVLQNMATFTPHYLYCVDPAWLTHDGPLDTFEAQVGHPSGSPGSKALTLPEPLEWAYDVERAKHACGAPVRFRWNPQSPLDGAMLPTAGADAVLAIAGPHLGLLTETPAPDAESVTVQPVSAIGYDATNPPEDQAPAMGALKDVGPLTIPRGDIRGWWPKPDEGFNSWRSLALTAQFAHPRPVTRCDIIHDGELVAFDDPSVGDGALDGVFSKGPSLEEGSTAALRLGLVRSAVSLRLRIGDGDEEVEAPILVPQNQIRRHRREYDAFSPV